MWVRTCHAEDELALGCPRINLQIRDDHATARGFLEAIGNTPDPIASYGKRLISDE